MVDALIEPICTKRIGTASLPALAPANRIRSALGAIEVVQNHVDAIASELLFQCILKLIAGMADRYDHIGS